MGSYCNLFIGDQEFSWKHYIPEVIGLLFEPSDYMAIRRRQTGENDPEEEEYEYTEHVLKTTCSASRSRLKSVGINVTLLRNIYFAFYAFNSNEYRQRLWWRCESYLQDKKGASFEKKQVDRMVKYFLRFLKLYSKDKEFNHVFNHHRTSGTRDDYMKRMKEEEVEVSKKQTKKPLEFDKIEFSRRCLKEFLLKDPYLPEEDIFDSGQCAGVPDLDTLYEICMPIYASDGNVLVEFEFTELINDEKSLSSSEVQELLEEMKLMLVERSKMMVKAFGRLGQLPATAIFTKGGLQRVTESIRREKGIKFEDMIQTFFTEQIGFEVKRNLKKSDQEIDLVIINRINDPFWTALQSPLILIECRNRRGKVEAKDIRDFEVKLQNYSGMCRIGIVISTSGFTKECFTVATRCSREAYRILLVDKHELEKRMDYINNTRAWLEDLILTQS